MSKYGPEKTPYLDSFHTVQKRINLPDPIYSGNLRKGEEVRNFQTKYTQNQLPDDHAEMKLKSSVSEETLTL